MLAAVKPVLQAHWGKAAPYATAEAQKLAICAVQIEAGYKSGELTAEEAGILRDMQASASRAALTTIETIGLIAAQDAINAALKVLGRCQQSRRHRDLVTRHPHSSSPLPY